jgi:hypothetical protein
VYTVISYRENGQVFRGGYCEGRTDSDFRLGTVADRDEAIDLLARSIFIDMVAQTRDMNKDYDYTEAAEIVLGINGYFGTDHSVDVASDEVYDNYLKEHFEMFSEAQLRAARLYSDKVRQDREAKERKQQQNVEAEARRQEAEERKQLARLKEKYGE